MSFTLPNPSTPTNGQLGDATPLLANETALAQAIASFDGTQIQSKSVVENALADAINPRLRFSENFASYVETGLVWSSVSGLNGTMTGGTVYVNGYRTVVSAIGSHTFTASNDTYIDVDYLGNIYYNGVANNATAPSLTANSIRIAKIVTSGSAITSVTQTGYDGNLIQIYPTSPIQTPTGFNVGSQTNAGTAGGTMYYINMGGIKMLWCQTVNIIGGTSPTGYTVTLPTGFFTTVQSGFLTAGPNNTTNQLNALFGGGGFTTTSLLINLWASTNTTAMPVHVYVIGT